VTGWRKNDLVRFPGLAGQRGLVCFPRDARGCRDSVWPITEFYSVAFNRFAEFVDRPEGAWRPVSDSRTRNSSPPQPVVCSKPHGHPSRCRRAAMPDGVVGRPLRAICRSLPMLRHVGFQAAESGSKPSDAVSVTAIFYRPGRFVRTATANRVILRQSSSASRENRGSDTTAGI
jgi:hypothetical protein